MSNANAINIDVEQRLNAVKQRINSAYKNSGRTDSVTLVGASKRQSSALVSAFIQHGLQDIGENYLQEALEKRSAIKGENVNWHYIGQIQSNKTKTIAENFNWVHGIDRLKIAQRIAKQNPTPNSPINLLVQLNPDDEAAKGGVTMGQAAQLCDQIAQLESVRIRGFMMIPKPRECFNAQRAVFASAQELLIQTNQDYGLSMDSLSMGMSGDLEAAISEGSTMVRIGTDLFGARN